MIRRLRDRRLWLVLAAVALVALARMTGLADLLSLDTLRIHRAAMTAWVSANLLLAALAFLVVYTAAVALSVPGAVFLTLAGGFLFGAFPGTLLTVIGATAGATLVFLFARLLFGPAALDRFGDGAKRIAEGLRREAWAYLLVLRLVPLFPFFLVNLVPAFVGVRLPIYAATTFLGVIPATFVFSLAGAGLGDVLDAGGPLDLRSILTPRILGGLLGLAALALLAIPLRRRFAGP